MKSGLAIDRDAIATIWQSRGVERIRIFGSATGWTFDEDRSDVDLVMSSAIRNPYFSVTMASTAEVLYAD